MDILTKNKSKLKLLAQKLITQETLEGPELEAVFGEIGLNKGKTKVKSTTIPVPIKPVAEGEQVLTPKKVPVRPQLIPKQNPAPTD